MALIRWVGSEVRIFAYFKNLTLIACFLGFGVGYFRARGTARLGLSLAVLVLVVAAVVVPLRSGWTSGPQIATAALSNFEGSIVMGDRPGAPAVAMGATLLGLFWTVSVFIGCFAILYGYAQRIGTDIEAWGRDGRLAAYSWNVAGSLAGILAFSSVSYFELPPLAWLLVVVMGTMPFLGGRKARGAALVMAALLVLLLPPRQGTIWSPYHKLEVTRQEDGTSLVVVNGIGYMALLSFRAVGPSDPPKAFDRWRLPYRIRPGARRVLVLGAGGGNDVSAALSAGAERVVAVEIDPAIYRIGKALHPDAPYDDPRVAVVIDDARHFVETTSERFDLIVFSHLDAHTALSGYTNVRLDNYIHTVESFRSCRRLLAAGGALYVSYWATQDWVATRLEENLRRAFGEPPVSYFWPNQEGVIQTQYTATDDPAVRAAAAGFGVGGWRPEDDAPPRPSTDDWPYLFVHRGIPPTPMLLLAVPLLGLCLVMVAALVRLGEGGMAGEPLDRHFFFLGAGFLLLEVHNVSRLALLFGTTWAVNQWVIGGVMIVILLANVLADRWPLWAGGGVVYGLLAASLTAGALIPVRTLAGLPAGWAWATLFYSLPLLFASLIFAGSFRAAPSVPRALGSNILGATLGGFLELASFSVGLAGLLWISLALYALSYRTPLQSTSGALRQRD